MVSISDYQSENTGSNPVFTVKTVVQFVCFSFFGEVGERFNPADLKSAAPSGAASSNLALSVLVYIDLKDVNITKYIRCWQNDLLSI